MQHSSRLSTGFAALVLIAAVLALAACSGVAPRTAPVKEEPKAEAPKIPKIITLGMVEDAYRDGDMILAERLATEFTSRGGLDAQQLGRGWRILTLAAAENKRPRVAVMALDRWRLSMDGVDGTQEWCAAWYNVMTLLPFSDAAKRAQEIIRTEKIGQADPAAPPRPEAEKPRPAMLIREAKLFIYEQRLLQGNGRASIPGLIEMYEGYERQADKRALEERTWKTMHRAGRYPLARLLAYTNDENESKYPFGLIRLENSRRLFWDVKTQDAARENVAFTREGSQLLSRNILRSWNDPDYSALTKVRMHQSAIALVLPLTGQYGNLSEKIVRGAETARRALEAGGQTIRIYVVDSDQPNWLVELGRLAPSVRIVGGPLRLEEYSAIKNTGFAGKRHFFTFLPRLGDQGEQDEGLYAWRFFPSREDQVRTMLDFSQKLGLTDYAIFAPDQGEYNQGMFDLFYYQAAERDLYITRAGYYPGKQYQLWGKNVSDFLGYSKDEAKDGVTQPPLNFQALFLPDNWSNSSRIISHIFYNMDNKVLFMGSNLWQHGLSGQQRLATRNYRLAVFPGTWDQQTLTPSGQLVRSSAALGGKYNADFWYSLGFDFVLAAGSLKLQPGASAEDVNAALGALPRLPWSGAPIKWDKNGFATQDLFVLSPAENGFALANIERIRERMKSTDATEEAAPEDSPVQLSPDEQLPPLDELLRSRGIDEFEPAPDESPAGQPGAASAPR